jgi:hypothetical protein
LPFGFLLNSIEEPNMSLAQLTYPSLVILAFAKAVEGNKELQTWLQENGYPELFMAAHAIRLQDPARQWLIKNGYPHLLAMIAAAEGDEKAQKWLKQYDYMVLYHIAMAVEHEKESWFWLRQNSSPELIILTKSIQMIKDQIEENHNDVHAIHKDL